MELPENVGKFWWTAKLPHYLPKALSADCVEGLGQVDKGHVEAAELFLTFLLDLAGSKYHICSTPLRSKPTLTFWQEALFQVKG